MNFTSEIQKFDGESKFTWTLKNLNNINLYRGYAIKSEEIEFKECNVTWYVKVVPRQCGENIRMEIKCYLCISKHDENALYNFDITFEDGSVLDTRTHRTIRPTQDPIELEVPNNFSKKMADSFVITARLIVSTIKYDVIASEDIEMEPVSVKEPVESEPMTNNEPKPAPIDELANVASFDEPALVDEVASVDEPVPSSEQIPQPDPKTIPTIEITELDEDYDHLSDVNDDEEEEELAVPRVKSQNEVEMSRCDVCYKNYSSDVTEEGDDDDDDSSIEEIDIFSNIIKKDDPSYNVLKMTDEQAAVLISKIYMTNMKEVADSSGCLFVSAAKNNHKLLLADCCKSLAAQISLKNFADIWEIGLRYNQEGLKNCVRNFVKNNREKLRYYRQISSDLMFNLIFKDAEILNNLNMA